MLQSTIHNGGTLDGWPNGGLGRACALRDGAKLGEAGLLLGLLLRVAHFDVGLFLVHSHLSGLACPSHHKGSRGLVQDSKPG